MHRSTALRSTPLLFLIIAVGTHASEASAQWWVGGPSYSLRADKYDSFFGEARPIKWSVERPPGVRWVQPPPGMHWEYMLARKREIHARKFHASSGYPAVYDAAYPSPYHAGIPGGDAAFYRVGYPLGYPVGIVAHRSQRATWRPPVVQVDPLPGDREESVPYPAEGVPSDHEAPPSLENPRRLDAVPTPEADTPLPGPDAAPEPPGFER